MHVGKHCFQSGLIRKHEGLQIGYSFHPLNKGLCAPVGGGQVSAQNGIRL